MEEWHQKLHNNTSPDDVVICEVVVSSFDTDFLPILICGRELTKLHCS